MWCVGSLVALAFAALPRMVDAGAGVDPAFERLETLWAGIAGYSITIRAHEVRGDRSEDSELRYTFVRPDRARLDVVRGPQSGATIVLVGPGDAVVAYHRGLSILKLHGNAHEELLTSLRGNGILTPSFGDVIACFAAHRGELREMSGPAIAGRPTDRIELPYAGVACPDDSAVDRGTVTLDAIDIARDTGLIVRRERYAGSEVVERWDISDYTIHSGFRDDVSG